MIRGLIIRNFMKLAHRFNWHYAPIHQLIDTERPYQRWCQWCGFRESYRYDPKQPPFAQTLAEKMIERESRAGEK